MHSAESLEFRFLSHELLLLILDPLTLLQNFLSHTTRTER